MTSLSSSISNISYQPQSLSELYHNHVIRQSQERHKLDKVKSQLVGNVSRTTELSVEYLNEGIARAYMNESRLNAITYDLQQQVTTLANEAENWLKVMVKFNDSLKALGDVVNWTECINYDVTHINRTLHIVAHGNGGNDAETSARPQSSSTSNQASVDTVKEELPTSPHHPDSDVQNVPDAETNNDSFVECSTTDEAG